MQVQESELRNYWWSQFLQAVSQTNGIRELEQKENAQYMNVKYFLMLQHKLSIWLAYTKVQYGPSS